MKKVFSTDYRLASWYDFENWLKETFKDVAGIDEESDSIKRGTFIVEFIEDSPPIQK